MCQSCCNHILDNLWYSNHETLTFSKIFLTKPLNAFIRIKSTAFTFGTNKHHIRDNWAILNIRHILFFKSVECVSRNHKHNFQWAFLANFSTLKNTHTQKGGNPCCGTEWFSVVWLYARNQRSRMPVFSRSVPRLDAMGTPPRDQGWSSCRPVTL